MRIGRVFVGLVVALAWSAGPVAAEVGEHCAFRLVPLERMGVATDAALEPIGCFATYEQAIEVGSGGTLDVAPDLTPTSLSEEALSLDATASDVLIGTEYDGSGYVGASTSYFVPSTCSSTVTWQVSYVGDAWNDRFQSGKGFGGCDVNRKFQHSNFGGDVRTCTPNCTQYEVLGNEVSSLRWRH